MKRFSKLKKAAAAILGAALMLTSLSVPAFATETADPVIDTTKKGSITINKYEGSDTTKPLEGVEFTIYKIAKLEQTTGNTTGLNLESLVTGIDKIDSTTTYDNIKNAIDDAIQSKELLPAASPQTTKLNSQTNKASVTFNNLDMGVYLVVETDAPPQVVDRSANFLVSVPMRNTAGTGWNYNIEANPKNQAVYGGINLIKKGTGGASLRGVAFTLQRQTNTNTWETLGTHTTGSNGSLNVTNLAPGTYRFIETDLGNNPGYILDGKTAYKFTVNKDGKIVIGDAQPTDVGKITVVNEKPDMTKQVQNRKDNSWGQDADYNVGDKVPYKITVDVPKNITDLETFTITDTPRNLKDDINSVKVKSGEDIINNDNSIYEVSQTQDEIGFTIKFKPSAMSAYAGKQLTIEYQAELLESAVTTTAGNSNTAKLEYSNMIKPDPEDTDNPNKNKTPGKNTIEDNAVVYTFKINVHKQDEKNSPLKDVIFDLYKEVNQNTPDAAQGTAANGLDKTKYWLKLKSDLKTNEQGNISVSGLANGDYYLVETKTVNEYNLLKEPVKVTLNIQYKTSMAETWEWVNDPLNNGKKLVKHTITSTDTRFTEGDTNSSNEGYVTQTVINKKGFTLPETGGMGTVLFGVGGAALALAGLYMILSSRKKSSK